MLAMNCGSTCCVVADVGVQDQRVRVKVFHGPIGWSAPLAVLSVVVVSVMVEPFWVSAGVLVAARSVCLLAMEI